MNEIKKYQLQDLIEQIGWLDKMIKAHKYNPSAFMREQYESEKEELLGQLIDALVEPNNRSPYSFKLIQLAISKFYPRNVKSKTGERITKDKHYKELKGLEAVLT